MAPCTCFPKSIITRGFAFIAEGIPVASDSLRSRYRRDALGDSSSNAVTAAFSGTEPATTANSLNA